MSKYIYFSCLIFVLGLILTNTANAELVTYLVPITVLKKDGPQQRAIPRAEVVDDASNEGLALLCDEVCLGAGGVVGHQRQIAGRRWVTALGPQELEQHLVAYRVDEGTEVLGRPDPVGGVQYAQHAQESLLPNVFSKLR